MGRPSLSKLSLPVGNVDPMYQYYMVPWAHPSPQPKRHLDRFSSFAELTNSVTDRPTDHSTQSVTIGRIYVCSTAMRPNNTNQAYSEYKHSLTFRVWRYVVIVVKPVHQLKICPIVHN